ncbi:putative reverse transcriptase domain-containing protein [Tanacetum coccineum]
MAFSYKKIVVEKKGKAKDEYYGKLILDLGNEVRFSMEQGTAAMEKLVEKLGNAKEKAECKKLKKELEEVRFSNTFLRMQNERVERDLYWTRVQAHEFYQEMIRIGFVFEERPNEAIDVPIEDEKSPSSEPRDLLMMLKDGMEVDIKEDENEPELTCPYEEGDPLNPLLPAFESEPEDVIEDSDGLLPGLMRRDINSLFGRMASLSRRLCGCETTHALVEKKGKVKDEYYGKLILDLGNEVRSSLEQETATMEKLGNAKEKGECKKLKKELEEARFSNTFLRMPNERVERDLYWTRVRAHEFYQEMIHREFVFEERPNEAIDVSVEDENSPSSKPIMPPKSAPLTQAAVRRMIKESVDASIAAERARHANAGNEAKGSGLVRGQDATPAVRECTFAGFMKCNPTIFRDVEGAVELRRWFDKIESIFGISECAEGKKVKFTAATLEGHDLTWWNSKIPTIVEEIQRMEHKLWNLKVKEYNIVAYTQRFNELALMCPRLVEPERVKVDAYIRGLTENIKGEVTSSKPSNLNEAVRMAYKLMEQKSQARDERILEGKKRKWENFQSGNSSVMTTAPTEKKGYSGSLHVCERCFTHHDGPCTIKCHKCGNVGHKARYCKEKSVATGANAQPISTCYDCGEQGHTWNRCPKKVKQKETREVCGRAYAIKDAEL